MPYFLFQSSEMDYRSELLLLQVQEWKSRICWKTRGEPGLQDDPRKKPCEDGEEYLLGKEDTDPKQGLTYVE